MPSSVLNTLFPSSRSQVRWLLDLRLRSRLTEETYSAAISRGKGPPWHEARGILKWSALMFPQFFHVFSLFPFKALKLLEAMHQLKLEARAAACTAAISACGTDRTENFETSQLDRTWALALGFFQQMRRWSVRIYDGTGAALASCELRWQGALAHLTGMRQEGIARLARSHSAAARACEASLADWRLSAALLETSERMSEGDQGKSHGRFLLDTIQTKIMTYSRSPYWNVALQTHHESNRTSSSMSLQAYNALMRAAGFRSWNAVLAILDEMYSEDVLPDSGIFASAVQTCGVAKEWEWILQLYDELQLNNLQPTEATVALARQACRVLGDDVRGELVEAETKLVESGPRGPTSWDPLMFRDTQTIWERSRHARQLAVSEVQRLWIRIDLARK